MQKLRGLVDPNFPGRDWNLATAMVINGKAGMQIMGDWAKGEFLQRRQEAGRGLPLLPVSRAPKASSPSTPTSSPCSRSARTQEAGQFDARQRDHGQELPGAIQPGQGLDPGAHRRVRRQVRRLRQEVDGRSEGGAARTTHARQLRAWPCGARIDQGRDDRRGHQVLQHGQARRPTRPSSSSRRCEARSSSDEQADRSVASRTRA